MINFNLNNLPKSLCPLVFGLFFIVSNSFAQGTERPSGREAEASKKTLMVGLKTGLSVNDFRLNGDADFFIRGRGLAKRAGGQALAFARYYMTDWVYGEIEAGWAQTAASLNYRNGFIVYRLNNIQSNLLFGFKLPILSVYEPKVYIGPSFDFNMHATEYVAGTTPYSAGLGVPIKRRTDVTNSFKSMDIAWIVGGQVDFDVKFARLILDVRYRHGMTNINNKMTSTNVLGARSLETSGLVFQVGLGFPL